MVEGPGDWAESYGFCARSLGANSLAVDEFWIERADRWRRIPNGLGATNVPLRFQTEAVGIGYNDHPRADQRWRQDRAIPPQYAVERYRFAWTAMNQPHAQPTQPKGSLSKRAAVRAATSLDARLACLWLPDTGGESGPCDADQALFRLQQRHDCPIRARRGETLQNQQRHSRSVIQGANRRRFYRGCDAWRFFPQGPARDRMAANPPTMRQDRRTAFQSLHAAARRKAKRGPQTGTARSETEARAITRVRSAHSHCPLFRTAMPRFSRVTVPPFRTHIDSSHRQVGL
jgi:hypothetical protein